MKIKENGHCMIKRREEVRESCGSGQIKDRGGEGIMGVCRRKYEENRD